MSNRRAVRRWLCCYLMLLVAGTTGCINSRSVHAMEMRLATGRPMLPPGTVAKIHLEDASVVTFRKRIRVTPDSIVGTGERWAIGATTSSAVAGAPRDSVVAVELFIRRTRWGRSALATTALYATVAALCLGPSHRCNLSNGR